MGWFFALAGLLFGGWCWWERRRAGQWLDRLTEQMEHFLLYEQEPVAPTLSEGSAANLMNQIARLEQQLLFQRDAAQRQERQTTRFVENMAHQMKNALTALQIQLDMLALRAGDEAQAPLQKSQDCMTRLTDEIDSILRSSQLAEGKIRMTFVPVDLRGELLACRERLGPIAARRDVRVEIAESPALLLPGDAFWLGQALENVLKNAVEHTAEGSAVTVRLLDEGAHIRVLVEDEGPGIPPEELPVLFERFRRGGTGKAGYGIGLAMARDILTAHHGSITARNRSGPGAVFTITLPVLTGTKPYDE